MFHQLRIRRKAVLTAARRKKYAKCDTLQCTGTWADPTGMNWSMLGVAVASYLESLHPHRRFWHAIRSFDNCSSGKFVIWRIPLSAQLTCWPVACLRWFRHSSKRNGYGYGGYGSKLSSHHPRKKKKKKKTSLVWLHCYPSLTRKSQFSDVTNQASKAPVRLRLVRFCEMLLGMLCILLSTSVGWSRSETPQKKTTRESSAFWTWIKLTDAKKNLILG